MCLQPSAPAVSCCVFPGRTFRQLGGDLGRAVSKNEPRRCPPTAGAAPIPLPAAGSSRCYRGRRSHILRRSQKSLHRSGPRQRHAGTLPGSWAGPFRRSLSESPGPCPKSLAQLYQPDRHGKDQDQLSKGRSKALGWLRLRSKRDWYHVPAFQIRWPDRIQRLHDNGERASRLSRERCATTHVACLKTA